MALDTLSKIIPELLPSEAFCSRSSVQCLALQICVFPQALTEQHLTVPSVWTRACIDLRLVTRSCSQRALLRRRRLTISVDEAEDGEHEAWGVIPGAPVTLHLTGWTNADISAEDDIALFVSRSEVCDGGG